MHAPHPDRPGPEVCSIRPARVAETGVLTAIAHEAKRYWGYPEPWIAAWREALTVTGDDLHALTVLVAEVDGGLAGFIAIDLRPEPAVVEHLWVRPGYMGQGIGRSLFLAGAGEARSSGHVRLEADADPNALDFYLKLGGVHTRDVPADVLGVARTLPRVNFSLRGDRGPRVPNGGTDVLAS